VAREIRRLADQTSVATQDIEVVIKDMQSAVATGVMQMDKFADDVRKSAEEVEQIAGQLGSIIGQVRALGPRFGSVTEGMHHQADSAQQISEAMDQLALTASQTKDALAEFKQATGQLTLASQGLQKEVSRFSVEA
jgi:methyl-accepting chemotaxis protein WspA